MQESKTTIKDLAKHLNISVSSVSRALSGAPGVSSANKTRVLELAEILNFQPNSFARSLKTNKSYTLGIVVPEVSMHFNSRILSGIMDVAFEKQYRVILCESKRNIEQELIDIRFLVKNKVDGILLVPGRASSNSTKERTVIDGLDIPLVLIDRNLKNQNIPIVTTNDFTGAYEAVNFLIKKGYKKIAHIRGHQYSSAANERFKGYKKALEDSNIDFNPNHVLQCEDFTIEEGKILAQQILKSNMDNPPDAFFTINDTLGVGVLKGVLSLGYKIPEDIGVIGFSNSNVSKACTPELSTVHQDAKQLGRTATELLIKKLKHKDFEIQDHLVETFVLERESTNRNSEYMFYDS